MSDGHAETKSIGSPRESSDGLRILVTRIRRRGLPKRRYSVWMASLGPSEVLLRAFQTKRISWAEFRRRYKRELVAPATFDARNRIIKNHGQKFTLRLLKRLASTGNVTLLCHCKEDEVQCHRNVLQRIIKSNAL